MNLIILSLTLLLAKSVKLDYYNYCGDVTGPNHEDIDMDKECKGGLPCLVKCCGPNEVIHKRKNSETCKKIEQLAKEIDLSNITEELTTYSQIPMSTKKEKRNIFQNYHLLYRKQFSANADMCTENVASDRFYLTETGGLDYLVKELHETVPDERQVVQAPKFCIEMMVGVRKTTNKTVAFYTSFVKVVVTPTPNKYELIFYGYFVSAFFLLLVLVVYGLLKKLHSNLNGMMLMVFMGSLLFTIVIGNGMNLRLLELDTGKNGAHAKDMYGLCKVLSPVVYFFYLSTFFWMNSMSFDIYRTFRNLRKVRTIPRRSIKAKFFRYGLYAWGMSAVLLTIALIIDFAPGVPMSVAKPQFKLCQRDYNNYLAKWYKYAPMLVLVSVNIILYMMTIYNIWLVHSDIEHFEENRKTSNKNQLLVFVKLSVVMGLNWIFELVLELATDQSLPIWLFYSMSIFNVLIGLIFFIILLCKRDVFIMLCRRFNVENRWTRGNTHVTSTSSHVSKVNARCKSKVIEDSIQIDSNADVSKIDEQKPIKPRFCVTKL